MDSNSVRNMYNITAVTYKHTAKLHHVGSLYILTYDARKIKHKKHKNIKRTVIWSCVYCILGNTMYTGL
jgi:hypothetical protein